MSISQDLAKAIQLAHRGIYQLEPTVAGKLVGTLNNFLFSSTQSNSATHGRHTETVVANDISAEAYQVPVTDE